jgi:TetR/AcrR family transcriptional repressor of nem operon
MATKKSSVREQAKNASREALLLAGIAEFSERGIDVPSLDDICARAGYTRGAFYVHFADRDDFLVAVMERTTGGFLDLLTRGSALPELTGTIAAFAAAVAGGALPLGGRGEVRLAHVLQAASRSAPVRKRFLGILSTARERLRESAERGQEQGTLRGGVPADAIGSLLVTLVLGMQVLIELGAPLDVTRDAQVAAELLGALPASPPRRKP